MSLNTRRHDELFDKNTFTQNVHVIGVGGVGSAVTRQLTKLGVGTLNEFHVWDGDSIESHNPPNQAYDPIDIGELKVMALRDHAAHWGDGMQLICHPSHVTEQIPLSGIVFLCLDSMRARKDICEMSLWNNSDVSLVIETRMDASRIVTHSFDPCNPKHKENWDSYWFDDDEAENEAGCGGHQVVIPTVEITAGIAVRQFIAHTQGTNQLSNRVVCDLRTWDMRSSAWE